MNTRQTSPTSHRDHRDGTPDSHGFATRPYDLVKEFVIALLVVGAFSLGLAAVFSSPDEPAITMAQWAKDSPADVVATAVGELAGSTTSAGYGAPYNTAADGQSVLGIPLQRLGGVRTPVDSAALVLDPLATSQDPAVQSALAAWKAGSDDQRTTWATSYVEALGKAPDGDPAKVANGDYGPVPALAQAFVTLAAAGQVEGQLTSASTFYAIDQTKPVLLLSDGAYLEDLARSAHLGGDQWGMMNETGNYPGQPWMWLYTLWYQVPPFSTSDNADAQVWALMMLLTVLLAAVPFVPGLRDIPRLIPLHRLIWKRWYAERALPAPASTVRRAQ